MESLVKEYPRIGLRGAGRGYLGLLPKVVFAILVAIEVFLFVYDGFVPGHTIILEKESGFVPWLNGGVLAAGALLCAVIFVLGSRRAANLRPAPRWHLLWLPVALFFAWFAYDDIAAVHEVVGRDAAMGIVRTFAPGEVTLPNAAWLAFFGPVFVMAALALLGILRVNMAGHPTLVRWGSLALGMWGLALALEAVGSLLLAGTGTPMEAEIISEEMLELVGATLFLAVFWAYAVLLRTGRPSGTPGPGA